VLLGITKIIHYKILIFLIDYKQNEPISISITGAYMIVPENYCRMKGFSVDVNDG